MTILDQLADYARERTKQAKQSVPLAVIRRQAEEAAGQRIRAADQGFIFEKALRKPDLAFICECKKASPSKGLIAPELDRKSVV